MQNITCYRRTHLVMITFCIYYSLCDSFRGSVSDIYELLGSVQSATEIDQIYSAKSISPLRTLLSFCWWVCKELWPVQLVLSQVFLKEIKHFTDIVGLLLTLSLPHEFKSLLHYHVNRVWLFQKTRGFKALGIHYSDYYFPSFSGKQ